MSKQDSISKRFFRSALGVLLARVLAFVAVFGFNAVLARALSPTDFGLFLLMFSLIGLASLFGCAGMNRALVKQIAQLGENTAPLAIRRLINIGLGTGTIGGALIGIAGGIATYYLYPSSAASSAAAPLRIGVLLAGIIWLRTIHLVMSETARGFHEKTWSNLFGSPAGGPLPHLLFLIMLLCTWQWFGLTTLTQTLTLYFASFAITLPPLMVRVYSLKFQGSQKQLSNSQTELPLNGNNATGSIMLLALPLMLTQTFGLTMSQADVWLAGALAVPTSLAIYCAAQRMLAFLTIPLQIAGTGIVSFVPELVAKRQTKRLQELVGLAATLAGIPGVLIGICFLIFPVAVLSFAFGEYYAQGADLLRILAIGQIICILTGPCEIVLMMAGHQNKTLVVNSIAAIAIFTLGPLAIIYFSITGLAITLATITSCQNLANWILAKRLLGIGTHVGAVDRQAIAQTIQKLQASFPTRSPISPQ